MGRLIGFFAALTRWGLGLCALGLIVAALYVSLGRELAPLVAQYRVDVEDKARTVLDMPLTIGSLEGRWHGFAPVLLAHDVMLGSGSQALRLDQVRVVPAIWASLMAREVRIGHLEVSGLQLNLQEDQTGHWSLEGLPVQGDQPLDPEQLLKRMQIIRKLSVLDSQVTLQAYEQVPLTLTYVGLNLEVGASTQRLDARMILPDGQPLALSLHTQVQAGEWRDGSAQAYLSLPQSDWARWLPARLTQQWKLDQLKAGGEFWLTFGNRALQSAVARLNAPQIRVAYAEREPVTIDNLALTAWLQRTDQGLSVSVDSLAMNLGKTRWETHLQVQQSPGLDQTTERWHLQADRLDLTPLTPMLMALVPLPEALAQTLDHLKVTGALRNVLLDYRPQDTGDQRLSFAANLERVGFDAYHGAPAARNVSGSISGDLGHGELRLDSKDFSLHLDPIFAKPWQYLQANARLTWRLDKAGLTLISPYLKVLGEEGKIAGDFLIRLHFDHDQEDYMDLRVGLVDGNGRYTAKYLPKVLNPAVDEWLRTAIIGGAVEQGFFQYQGALNHGALPVARNISLFFKVHDAELAFQPGWPQAERLKGNVLVENTGVRIKASQGQLLNTQLNDVFINIPHVAPGQESHLYLEGGFVGSVADGLKILQEAPIGTGSTFAGWQGEGSLQGNVNLDIPLTKGVEPKILVDLKAENGRLNINSPALELTQLKGGFHFDNSKGLSAQEVSGQVFGRPVSAQIVAEGKPGKLNTRITAKGQIALKALSDWLNVSQKLPVSGDIPYQLQIMLAGPDSQLLVSSDLKGAAVDLPAPFGLASGAVRPSIFRMTLQGDERRYWFDYGDLAHLAYAAPAGKVANGRGELLLGEGSAMLPMNKGMRIRGALSELELQPWKDTLARYTGEDPGGSAKQVLNSAEVSIGRFKGFGTELDGLDVKLDRGSAAWVLQLDSQQAKGRVSLPDAKSAPVDIELQYARLPASKDNAEQDGADPLANVDPRQIPALNIAIGQLFQGPDLLGAWSMKIRPTPKGILLSDLNLGLKGLQLQGSGGWEGAPGSATSWVNGHVKGENLADELKAWGFAPTVTSQSFKLELDGRWPGSPAWISPERFSGSLDATMLKGQFVEVEGGASALRMFGLLNFNAIGRRLRLDFSDLFGKGLSYDEVKGLLVASDGVYVTRNPITLEGPSGNLELNGTLDMVGDRVDAKARVTLPLTTNLPMAALIVGAPAVGGALFLIDKLVGDRVSRLTSVQYKIEGPWKDPKITFDKP